MKLMSHSVKFFNCYDELTGSLLFSHFIMQNKNKYISYKPYIIIVANVLFCFQALNLFLLYCHYHHNDKVQIYVHSCLNSKTSIRMSTEGNNLFEHIEMDQGQTDGNQFFKNQCIE